MNRLKWRLPCGPEAGAGGGQAGFPIGLAVVTANMGGFDGFLLSAKRILWAVKRFLWKAKIILWKPKRIVWKLKRILGDSK
jgi:hypothetical protein